MPITKLLSLDPNDKAYQKRVSKRLTRKEELFVKALVSQDGEITNTEAAIQAGYAKGSAAVRASEMLNPYKCPHVVRALQTYRNELDRKFAVTYQRHIRRLDQLSRRAEESGAYSAAVMAEYRRGQAQGIYVERKEILHGSIDTMNKDEILRRLKEIKNDGQSGSDLGPLIEHQPAEEEAPSRKKLLSDDSKKLVEAGEE
jgi:hypothetical protein